MLLGEWLDAIRDKLAAIDMDGISYSYGDLAALGERLLPLDETPGRRLILLMADNSIEALALYLRALLMDHVILMGNPDDPGIVDSFSRIYRPDIIAGTGPSGFDVRTIRAAPREQPLHPDLAVLLSTSGSTGSPKLVRLSHDNIWANARSIADYLAIQPDDRGLLNLPMHYSYGLSIINSHIVAGAAILLDRHSMIEPAFWTFARDHGATSFAGVPHSYDLLDRIGLAEHAPPTLRYHTQAGGRLQPASVTKYATLAREKGWRFFVMYGQTEATARMAYLPPELTLEHPTAIGIPIPQGRFELRDPDGHVIDASDIAGELIYHGPNVMMGYALSAEDLSLPAGIAELATGDLAMRSIDGLYRITGRLSRFVKIFGKRIGLDDVERILADEGFDAIATGIDDKLLILSKSQRRDEIDALLQRRLALPPAYFEIREVEDYPTLSSGKIDYKTLKDGLEAQRDHPVHSLEGTRKKSIPDAFIAAFGERARDLDQSFISLGGDSLNYVTTALEIEEHIGTLPDLWETRSIRELCLLAEQQADHPAPLQRGSASRFHAIANFDTLRGLACMLVVAYHVVGLNAQAGLRLEDGSPWRVAVDSLIFVRMPLFAAMAGYLYALMPQLSAGYGPFLARKARTLLLPAIVVGLITYSVREVVYHDHDDLWAALFNGYLHLWYIYALMVVFAMIGLIDILCRPKTLVWIGIILLSVVLYYSMPFIDFFSISYALSLTPYFVFGILLCRNANWIKKPVFLMVSATFVLFYLGVYAFFAEQFSHLAFGLIRLAASLGVIACLFRWMPSVRWLALVGPFSFAIYLWHPFANAAVRTLLWRLGLTAIPVMFLAGLAAGILLPILLYKLLERFPRLSLPLVGR